MTANEAVAVIICLTITIPLLGIMAHKIMLDRLINDQIKKRNEE